MKRSRQSHSDDSPSQAPWLNHPASPAYDIAITRLFEAQASRTPREIAVSSLDSALTYQQLNERANQIARYLRLNGVRENTLVAIYLPRSLDLIVAFLGTLKAGGAYIPLDPDYPAERRIFMLDHSQAPLLITQPDWARSLDHYPGQILCLEQAAETIAQYSTANLEQAPAPDHLAYMIYTSGSTGQPKGVLIPHRGLSNHAQAMAQLFALAPGDRVLQFASLSFDIIVEELYPSFLSGATVVLRPETLIYSIQVFLDYLDQHQITVLNLPTAFWHELVYSMDRLQRSLPRRTRLVVVGGEKARRSAYRRWQSLVGSSVRWINTYGPTETTVSATYFDPSTTKVDPETEEIPIGLPLPNVETFVLDENLQPVPPGQVGELHIGGAGLAVGYHRLPSRTAERFIPNPLSPQQLLYKTGDLVRQRSDGHLEYVGRQDFRVKIRGFRIEPAEIETCLERHPDVSQAVVTVHQDAAENSRLVAYVVPQPRAQLDPEGLRDFSAATLPDYMVPRSFVLMTDLPLNANGKVDRHRLSAPAPDRQRTITPPDNDLETQLISIWQRILGVHPIGVTDNFFELGGHSLLVARFFSELEASLGHSAPLTLLLEAPTIRELATRLTRTSPSQGQALVVPLRGGQTHPPLFLLHDADGDTSLYLNLAAQMRGDRAVYGLQARQVQGQPEVYSSLTAMAADYCQAIQAIQPHGPYLLGGLCAGGVLAFEVALQLQAQGKSVALLALMESPDVQAVAIASPENSVPFAKIKAIFAASPSRLKGFQQAMRFIVMRTQSRFKAQLATWLEQGKAQILITYWANGPRPIPGILHNVSVRTLYLQAEKTYQPSTRFQGSILLIKASQGTGFDQPYGELYAEADLGWGKRTTGEIQIFTVAGGHTSMLSTKNVSQIAQILEQRIDQGLSPSTPATPAPSVIS
ncbi:amino acid adenylation domain-containing protein [Lyngbya confervoides]|uniref:Amino acid adenylation domain-containing protein n=1 Tax=Lyngbya confervoides BDU141951 TaxID=1574623 RepID=A0ABD4T7E0_9CYAN|nr:amino acid adenylation domain-containing protein [Lyngbya confervoides]MCM1984681.1 amino acid adenylation domain-containing protein [Lyngbya confervoides BDU141951]